LLEISERCPKRVHLFDEMTSEQSEELYLTSRSFVSCKLQLRVQTMTTVSFRFRVLLIVVSLNGFLSAFSSEKGYSQSSEPTTALANSSEAEHWFGWLITPKQQLRTIIHLKRGSDSQPMSATIVSPDQSPDELPLVDFVINSTGTWQFKLNNPINPDLSATFEGKQTSNDQVVGDLTQSGEKLPLKLDKIEEIPVETRTSLGADSVWLGTLNLVVKKMDVRFRVYNQAPFATPEEPRILFDSLSEKIVGIPAVGKKEDGPNVSFEIELIKAKYTAKLNEAGDEMTGRFVQGPVPIPLTMKLQVEETTEKSANANPQIKTADPISQEQRSAKTRKGNESDTPKKPKIASSPFFVETEFQVTHSIVKQKSKPKDKATGESAQKSGITLAGTLTVPRARAGSEPKRYPAVIMVTGSGPQDRNETIGRHKPFETIAHFLAKNGIASLRYDDRGVGASTGEHLTATSEDFARDALAVWKHAATLSEIDPERIGILGHSEGGLIGPMAAAWEPGVAFLILLAPPGLTGADVLSTQIDRMSELQGMSEEDRIATMSLQQELQDIAGGYFVSETATRNAIRAAVNKNWEGLKNLALSQDPLTDLSQVKQQLTSTIEQQFQQLRMPWYRFYLNYDPSMNWMLIRCPTLAIWGSNDVQVLPEINRAEIFRSAARNVDLTATLEVLPGLNHLLQTSETGLPSEYDQIEEDISPTALSSILRWAEEQGLVEAGN